MSDAMEAMPMQRLNGWPLFCFLAALVSAPVLLAAPFVDPGSLEDTLLLTRLSNRGALPFLVITFAASALVRLWPSAPSRWLMKNRKYFGLAFAVGMASQVALIVRLAAGFPGYYFTTFPLTWPSLIPWSVFAILALMTLTSFKRFASLIGGKAWRLLHKAGMYVFWLIFTAAYGGKVLYGPAQAGLADLSYLLAFTALLAAWALRIGAWFRRRGALGAVLSR